MSLNKKVVGIPPTTKIDQFFKPRKPLTLAMGSVRPIN